MGREQRPKGGRIKGTSLKYRVLTYTQVILSSDTLVLNTTTSCEVSRKLSLAMSSLYVSRTSAIPVTGFRLQASTSAANYSHKKYRHTKFMRVFV